MKITKKTRKKITKKILKYRKNSVFSIGFGYFIDADSEKMIKKNSVVNDNL